MDAVQSFNNELCSMFEMKPPISKAKMTSVTKAAIKAIKFYKHVVQSVEKFIQKSRSEYKVPGLYVIDSIVRQSRHQFGADKDVYAMRFSKNFTNTFQHLFKCPVEEKSKIVRVLNLWQKNSVFSSEVIQPLLDMANPNHMIHQQTTPSSNVGTPTYVNKKSDGSGWSNLQDTPQNSQMDQSQALKSMSQMLQQSNSMTTSDSILQGGSGNTAVDSNLVLQLQQITNLLTQQSYMNPKPETTVKFNKKLLAFDYGDEDDEDEEQRREEPLVPDNASMAVSMAQNLLSNPDILRQLQQMQQTIQQTEALKTEVSLQEQLHKQRFRAAEEEFAHQDTAQSLFSAQMLQASHLIAEQAAFNQSLNQSALVSGPVMNTVVQMAPSPSPVPLMPVTPTISVLSAPPGFVPIPAAVQEPAYNSDMFPEVVEERPASVEEESGSEREKEEHGGRDVEVERQERARSPRFREEKSRSPAPAPSSRGKRRTRRSRSRSRSPKRRARSKSRSRSRSRSRTRYKRDRDRSREREKEKEKERERERKKRGLPPIRKDSLSVCSTTLWLGHVSKLVSQEDLADVFGEIGDIVSIDLIPPRGCAFVCMNRRQDSNKALQKLKHLKLQGKTITMAWAPGKGVKGKDFKDYWDVDLGVSYIPWNKIPDDVDLDSLEDGSMIDEETIPDRLRERMNEKARKVVKDVDLRDSGAVDIANVGMGTPNNPVGQPSDAGLPMQATVPVIPPMVPSPYGIPGIVTGQALSMIQLPMGVPPGGQLMMLPQVGQQLLGQSMPVLTMVGQHFGIPPPTTAPGKISYPPLPLTAAPSDILPPLPLENPGEERGSGRETADSTSTDMSLPGMQMQTSSIPMPSGQPMMSSMTPTRSEVMDIGPPPCNMQGPPMPIMPPGGPLPPPPPYQPLQPPPPPFNMGGPLLGRPPAFRLQHPNMEPPIRMPPVSMGMMGPGPPRDMTDRGDRRRSMESDRESWDRSRDSQDGEGDEFQEEESSPIHRPMNQNRGVSPPRSMGNSGPRSLMVPPLVSMGGERMPMMRHMNPGGGMPERGPRPMMEHMGPPRGELEGHGRFGPPQFQGGLGQPMGRFPAPRMPGMPPPRPPFPRFPHGPGGPSGHGGPGPSQVSGPAPLMPGSMPHRPMAPPPQPRALMMGYPRGPGAGAPFMRPGHPQEQKEFGMRGPPQHHHAQRMPRPFDDRFRRHDFDNGDAERRLRDNNPRQRHQDFNRHEEDMGHEEEFQERGGDWRRDRGRGRGMGGPGRDRFGRGGFNHEERFGDRFEREWEPRDQWEFGGKRNRGRDRDQGHGDRGFRGDRGRDRDRGNDAWDHGERDDQQRERGGRRSRWCEPATAKMSEDPQPENGAQEESTKECDTNAEKKDTSKGNEAGNGPQDVSEKKEPAEVADVTVNE